MRAVGEKGKNFLQANNFWLYGTHLILIKLTNMYYDQWYEGQYWL